MALTVVNALHPRDGVGKPDTQAPVYNGPTSLAIDRPRVYVAVDPEAHKPDEEIVDCRDLPAEYFHADGEIPEEWPIALRKKQIVRMYKRRALYQGGPTLDEALDMATS